MLLKAGAHINLQQHNEETALILVSIDLIYFIFFDLKEIFLCFAVM